MSSCPTAYSREFFLYRSALLQQINSNLPYSVGYTKLAIHTLLEVLNRISVLNKILYKLISIVLQAIFPNPSPSLDFCS